MFLFFFFNLTPTTEIYTLSLHDALPISNELRAQSAGVSLRHARGDAPLASRGVRLDHSRGRRRSLHHHEWTLGERSEEHTSELQSRQYLVCRLLLEKKKTRKCQNTLQPA